MGNAFENKFHNCPLDAIHEVDSDNVDPQPHDVNYYNEYDSEASDGASIQVRKHTSNGGPATSDPVKKSLEVSDTVKHSGDCSMHSDESEGHNPSHVEFDDDNVKHQYETIDDDGIKLHALLQSIR